MEFIITWSQPNSTNFVSYHTCQGSQFTDKTSISCFRSNIFHLLFCTLNEPQGLMGIWGEGLFIFRELGSTSNYFQGFGEQAHILWYLGCPAKK